MNISVNYTTQLKAALGFASEEVTVDNGCRLSGLLKHLTNAHPEAFGTLVVNADGRLLPSVLICVGDKQIRSDDDIVLADGESVTFLSAISGG